MKHIFDYIRKHKGLLFIIVPAFFIYMLLIFLSGTFICFKDACGINFWGVHGHDGIWHLAIANVSFSKFPFIAPTFSGESLYGYNYLLDFFISIFARFGIPAVISYFKIFPVIWFIFFTSLLIVLGRKIKDSPVFVSLFLFFNYFAGSFYYLIKLYRDHSINDSSTQLPQPAVLMMSNPPFAFSLLLFLFLLIFIKDKKLTWKNSLYIGICIFIVMGLKFYGGLISIFLIEIYLLYRYVVEKKLKEFVIQSSVVGLFVLAGVFIFYNPVVSLKTGSIFGFAPFALVHTITEETNKFYLRGLTDARYYIYAQKKIGPRLIGIEVINLIIFLFFYLGTRFFGLIYLVIQFLRKKLSQFDAVIVSTIVFSTLLTVLLVQKAEWWNTMQFFYYAIFLSTIYLTKLTFDLLQTRKTILIVVAVIIMVLSVPASFDMLKFFLEIPGAAYLPKEEEVGLNFLKTQPDGIVYKALYNKKWKNYLKQNKLYTYTDTAYVAAFTGKQEYFSDELQLKITGIPYQKRLEKMKKMDCSILKEVDYVYEIRELLDEEKIMVKCKHPNSKIIFINGKVVIYSISRQS